MPDQVPIDIEKFRGLLQEERKRLMRIIHPANTGEGDPDQADLVGDLSDYPDHPGDQGTETYMRDRDDALVENERYLLTQVEDALRKIDSGAYGICSSCHKPIPEARLNAHPSSLYCVPCQSSLEGR